MDDKCDEYATLDREEGDEEEDDDEVEEGTGELLHFGHHQSFQAIFDWSVKQTVPVSSFVILLSTL